MNSPPPNSSAPFVCIFCDGRGPFGAEEHIIPHSLGNDLLVLSKGWVCDRCNNVFSQFESRVLYSSILGFERCRLGVTTKRGRPARSETYGVSWFARPSGPPNVVEAATNWIVAPLLLNADGSSGKIVLPLHDDTNSDVARLLLKIGIEILTPVLISRGSPLNYDLSEAKQHLLRRNLDTWPYFVLRYSSVENRLQSVLACVPEEHEYVRSLGFDVFLHEVDGEPILFFVYDEFCSAICLTSRSTSFRQLLVHWNIPHVGCPVDYSHLSA